MKRIVAIWSLMLGCAQPVWAGHGTIHETDTEIVIEYSGDANDKAGDQEKKTPPGSTEQTEELRTGTRRQEESEKRQEKMQERQRARRTSGQPGPAAKE
ncbi:hypothetical protein F6V25_13195 [Oryzomonas japonica]|uniref:Uncharacterized protein n=1 Tax=Oryzomonas japonica TaxID=2603858 RepID=A0A7J4ZNU3_9BACT|nr:hypothetical protein [Oryzomonas japonica]KAB0664488.1 hypothetical protein F6V25_13195 [Oryzomonas japonica]